jgi:hypothetical protein
LLNHVIEGYRFLGLDSAAGVVRDVVAPVAAREQEWRESLRDGGIETFSASYDETQLAELDDRIEVHDDHRVAYVRAHPELFAG